MASRSGDVFLLKSATASSPVSENFGVTASQLRTRLVATLQLNTDYESRLRETSLKQSELSASEHVKTTRPYTSHSERYCESNDHNHHRSDHEKGKGKIAAHYEAHLELLRREVTDLKATIGLNNERMRSKDILVESLRREVQAEKKKYEKMENDKLRYESDVKNQGKYLRNSKTEFDLLCSMSVKMQESFASTADEFNKLTREYHDSVDTIGKLSKKCDDLNRDIERMEEHSANQSEELYRLRATANNTTSSLQKATHQIEQRKAREERLEANIKELTEQLNREMNKSAGIYKLLAETEGKAAAAMESAASSQSYAEETLKRTSSALAEKELEIEELRKSLAQAQVATSAAAAAAAASVVASIAPSVPSVTESQRIATEASCSPRIALEDCTPATSTTPLVTSTASLSTGDTIIASVPANNFGTSVEEGQQQRQVNDHPITPRTTAVPSPPSAAVVSSAASLAASATAFVNNSNTADFPYHCEINGDTEGAVGMMDERENQGVSSAALELVQSRESGRGEGGTGGRKRDFTSTVSATPLASAPVSVAASSSVPVPTPVAIEELVYSDAGDDGRCPRCKEVPYGLMIICRGRCKREFHSACARRLMKAAATAGGAANSTAASTSGGAATSLFGASGGKEFVCPACSGSSKDTSS